jgi:dynein heavy chain, axonemal
MALEATTGVVHKDTRFNPKAIRAPEMYGEIDPLSGEWTTGVFAAMWAKYNNRNNAYNTWIIADGPVDAIWIEDLNTVLDDNKILTLANGDRIPMTDNVKVGRAVSRGAARSHCSRRCCDCTDAH